jgi:hypothetical protein
MPDTIPLSLVAAGDTNPPVYACYAAAAAAAAVSSPNPSLLDCSPSATATTGTLVLSRADDKAAAVTLPFAFSLYGSSYTTATVSSNGWVSFGDSGAAEVCNVETSWPNGPCLGSGPVLAVFWGECKITCGLASAA